MSVKRKAEKLANKVKVITPIRKVSAKKANDIPRYSVLKQKYLEFKMGCEALLPGCTVSAKEIHHCSKSETNFLNMETWLGCCHECHRTLENLPAEERRAKGWLTD